VIYDRLKPVQLFRSWPGNGGQLWYSRKDTHLSDFVREVQYIPNNHVRVNGVIDATGTLVGRHDFVDHELGGILRVHFHAACPEIGNA
jgi:hypothetical protein